MPEGALAKIFRAKLCAALKKAGLLGQVPRQVWKKKWVANCKAAGQGRQVLNYLARYIFRVAISNSRLERIENGEVTFRYRDNRSQQLRRETVTGEEFRGWDNQVVCARPKSHVLSHPLNPPLPLAHSAPRLCQGTLLRHLESFMSRATRAGAHAAEHVYYYQCRRLGSRHSAYRATSPVGARSLSPLRHRTVAPGASAAAATQGASMMMIVILARGFCNRSAPAALLVLMRRPATALSGAAFVRRFVNHGELLSAGDGECRALPNGLNRLNPPPQK